MARPECGVQLQSISGQLESMSCTTERMSCARRLVRTVHWRAPLRYPDFLDFSHGLNTRLLPSGSSMPSVLKALQNSEPTKVSRT